LLSTHLRLLLRGSYGMRRTISKSPAARFLAFCLLACSFALVGCGGGGSGSEPLPPPPSQIESVTITSGTNSLFTGTSLLFTAKVSGTGPFNASVAITATSVQDSTESGNSGATIYAPATLTSITPTSASAGEQVTINGQNVYGPTALVFTGANGMTVAAVLRWVSLTQVTATVWICPEPGDASFRFPRRQ